MLVMSAQLGELVQRIKLNLECLKCDFVDPFPKEVQWDCPICLQTLREPYAVDCCGYRFCNSCLLHIRCCPLCKSQNFNKFPDKHLQRLLNQRVVYCLLRDSGCKWTGELCKLPCHINLDDSLSKTACDYMPFPCEFCESYFKRSDMLSHRSVCISRPSVCIFCKCNYQFKELFAHIKICSKRPRLCKNECGDRRYTLEEMEAHIAKECPLEMISCEFHFAGCGKRFLRKDLEEHMEDKAKTHLQLMTLKYKKLQEKEKKSTEENARLLTSIAELTFTNEKLAAENALLKKESEKDDNCSIIVTNIPPGASQNDIKSVFGQFGPIAKVVNNQHHAVIKYCRKDDCERALSYDTKVGIRLLKHRLKVQSSFVPMNL